MNQFWKDSGFNLMGGDLKTGSRILLIELIPLINNICFLAQGFISFIASPHLESCHKPVPEHFKIFAVGIGDIVDSQHINSVITFDRTCNFSLFGN